ncbi:SUKH-4 family immunity protein [Streptomyces kronopolitis]|uniref:SUKH-4 family immunity protein n=1 Tax=Streptomyces kronopolitis TaxID=1612435 RepID=UPI00343670AF
MSRGTVVTRLTEWLQGSGQDHLTLAVSGPVGSGKTSVVGQAEEACRDAGDDISTSVDCRGLTADDVATRLIGAWGGDERFRRTRKAPLAEAFAHRTHGKERAVVLFSNVQWAGGTATSTEPGRVLTHVIVPLLRAAACPVAVLFEADQEQERVPVASTLDAELLPAADTPPDSESAATSGPPPAEYLTQFPQLRALAAAEIRDIPLRAAAVLCTALDLPAATPEELLTTAHALPQLLTTRTDGTDGERLAFRTDGIRHLLCAQLPLSRAEHERLTEALLGHLPGDADAPPSGNAPDPVAAYAFRTLPLHAAAAGKLAALARDPRFLAHVDRHALLTGLALTYPAGIPAGIPASDVHYLEAAGVEPSTHEEWLSWLHWASLNRGATDVAAELARAAALPWHTLWSRWRPYGLFGPSPRHDDAAAEELVLGLADGTAVVASQQEIDEDDLDDEVDPDADWYAVERVWTLDDGTPLGDAVQVQLSYGEDDEPDQADGRAFEPVAEPDEAEEVPSPRTPSASTCLVKAVDGVQVHGGSGGLYALRVLDPTRVTAKPSWRARPLLAPHNTAAVWELPEAARTEGTAARAWYEDVFGPGSCRIVPPDALPDGLVHPASVRFLTEVGVPDLDAEFRHLSFTRPHATGPTPLPSAAGAGPFFRMGHWVRGDLLLDGTSGRLYVTEVGDGDADHLVSGGLREACTLLALAVQCRESAFTVRAEELDARRSLAAWAQAIDPVAASHPHWTAILSGHWDDPDAV